MREYAGPGHPLTHSHLDGAEWVGMNYMLDPETLQTQTEEFFGLYYSARNMHLVVAASGKQSEAALTSEPLERLMLKTARFIKIPGNSEPAELSSLPLYNSEELPVHPLVETNPKAWISIASPGVTQVLVVRFEVPRISQPSEFVVRTYCQWPTEGISLPRVYHGERAQARFQPFSPEQ